MQQLSALIPVSVSFSGQTVDLSLPAHVAVAELLPGMVRSLGRLSAESATQGYGVRLPSGSELSQSLSLAQQDVHPGTLLTLEVTGSSTENARYDDIVEAVGTAISQEQLPWRRGDSVQLSAYCSVALFVIAAFLLVTQSRGMTPAIISGVGAILVTLAAAVVARWKDSATAPEIGTGGQSGAAVALAMTVPVLTGCAAFVAIDGARSGLPLFGAGVGAIVGALAGLVLPVGMRIAAAGPLTAGIALILVGGLTEFAKVPVDHAAALAISLLSIVVLSAPWMGMAHVPMRIDPAFVREIDGNTVQAQVHKGSVLALSVKAGAALAIVGFVPLVAASSLAGSLLAVCVGTAFMLATRSLYGRADVLVGVISGMAITVIAGLSAASHGLLSPSWTVVIAVAVGVIILAMNVVSQRMRPMVTRCADALNVLAIVAILPLTAAVWDLV